MDKSLITRPIISEKSTALSAMDKYTFLVAPHATLPEVRKAVQGIYGVRVIRANVVAMPPKPKRYRQYIAMNPGYKKVIVTLKKGEKIDLAG